MGMTYQILRAFQPISDNASLDEKLMTNKQDKRIATPYASRDGQQYVTNALLVHKQNTHPIHIV